jgi:YD repeat-containing protein
MTGPFTVSIKYTYDAENQLTSVSWGNGVTLTYSYDPAGNRIAVGSAGSTAPNRSPAQGEQDPSPAAGSAPKRFCGNCGALLTPGRQFCGTCGQRIP